MPVSPVTNEFMRALPPALRPNPYSLDEHVMAAVEKGWSIQALAEASYANERNPNPAFIVTNVRHLSEHPPTQTKRLPPWQFGHMDCDRHVDCQLCRCSQGVIIHHVSIPMPEEVRATIRAFLPAFGRIPE